jgi:hypothetical protein
LLDCAGDGVASCLMPVFSRGSSPMLFRQKQLLPGALSLLFFLILSVPAAPAQFDQYGRWENGVGEPWSMDSTDYSQEEAATAQARWKAIGEEMQSAGGNAWVGNYFTGDETHGRYLRWAEQSGFVLMHVDKCAARVMNFSYGKVTVTPDLISFVPERMPVRSSPHGDSHPTATKYIPARWRGAHYLISENQIAAFGDYVAGLGDFNAGLNPAIWVEGIDFLYKVGDREAADSTEAPSVPTAYQRFIRKPIEASIITVSASRIRRRLLSDGEPFYESRTIVTINVGRGGGVRRGMVFRVRESPANETVRILRVGRDSSLAEIIRDVDEDKKEIYYEWIGNEQHTRVPPVISVGWLVTTAPL